MGIANCKNCGRLYNQTHRDICPVCVKDEEEKFIIIREYLKKQRGASTYEVSEATGIDTVTIMKFIREGRLSTYDNPNLNYPCETCGAPTVQGRFCQSCTDRLKSDFSNTKKQLQNTADDSGRGSYFQKRERN